MTVEKMKKKARKRTITWVLILAFALPIIVFSLEWIFFAGGMKCIYYNFINYDADEVRVVESEGFVFDEKNYSHTYILDSDYYVPHRILLMPDSKNVPTDYQYGGEFVVEFYEDDTLLKSVKMSHIDKILRYKDDDYYDNYLVFTGTQAKTAKSIFAFEIGEIPFDLIRLKWGRLKTLKIKITVLEPDMELKEYCDSATLLIIPDLRM